MFNIGDTIVAVSSPPGGAARGIVRLSGPLAIELAAGVFAPDGGGLATATARTRISGTVDIAGTRLPAVAFVFRKPESYTRDDLVELHLMAAPGVLALLLDRLVAAGARRAEGGEFTARAFLAGELDLSAAQGVSATIAAQSDSQLQAARRMLEGELSALATAAREELGALLALVEGSLDFADEPIEFVTAAELRARLSGILERLTATLAAGAAAERFGELPRVLLSGAPNAGKSSLLNRLTGLDRAICSPVAGTTRDCLAAAISLASGEALLLDVAGLEGADDELDAAAQRAARRAAETADLVLQVIDASGPIELREDSDCGCLYVLNKVDLIDVGALSEWMELFRSGSGRAAAAVSARTGFGCEALQAAIAERLGRRTADAREGQLALAAEQREGLSGAIAAIERARELARGENAIIEVAELIALELHEASGQLGLLVGELVPDELLGRIFARFCVGK